MGDPYSPGDSKNTATIFHCIKSDCVYVIAACGAGLTKGDRKL